MKRFFIAIAILYFSTAALGHCARANDHVYSDTLDTYSQYGHQRFVGHITVFDKEDAIGQVEINSALTGADVTGTIFADGFESYAPNWIVVGDDTFGNEFGLTYDCFDEQDYKDHDGTLHVTLSNCHLMSGE